MTLMGVNKRDVDDIVQLADTMGADSVKFNIVQPAGRGSRVHEGLNGLKIRELIDLGLMEFVNHKLIAVADIDAPF